jgi:hypothetical protein
VLVEGYQHHGDVIVQRAGAGGGAHRPVEKLRFIQARDGRLHDDLVQIFQPPLAAISCEILDPLSLNTNILAPGPSGVRS